MVGNLEPIKEGGLWKCPVCGFTAMTRKVVEAHISREHKAVNVLLPLASSGSKSKEISTLKEGSPSESSETPSKSKGSKKGKGKSKESWASFRIGKTLIKVRKPEVVEVRESRGWNFFQTANYVATLHNQRATLVLITGEKVSGTLGTKDPFWVKIYTDDGRKLLVNKSHIVYIEPESSGGGNGD